MVFHPRQTFTVDLFLIADPDARAQEVINRIPTARPFIGRAPTHCIVDKKLLINTEMLEEAGLEIIRRPLAWPSAESALLAVPMEEPDHAAHATDPR